MTFISCDDNDNQNNPIRPINSNFSNLRSFHMGFTPFPFDLTLEALDSSYQYALQNGDIVLIHLDHGVPWNEALNDLPFPTEIQNTIDDAVSHDTPNHKIMLTVTSTNTNRDTLAFYWNNNGSHQPLPAPWDGYNFDTPDVITAYIKYCKRLIDQVNPDYFAYGIEINSGFLENSDAFNRYIIHADTVYRTLKNEYPNLPIFLTFQDQSFNKNKQELHQLTKILVEYSDMMAVSTYPFWLFDYPTQDANPIHFSSNWLKEMSDLAPNKPFAVSETGYCAESLLLSEVGVIINGTEQWQKDYVLKLFREANKLNAKFINWFVYRDYDLLYNATTNPPLIFKVWRDNGLLDGNGNKREAHDIWNQWLQYPIGYDSSAIPLLEMHK